ncbi:MAG: LemA family protein [bacterium]|nr:LemA family protein [bacterium]
MKKTTLIILALVVFIGLSAVGYYNTMVRQDEALISLNAQVSNMYERRADLIPQVAAAVKKYAEYESGTLANVVGLREGSKNLETLQSMAAAGQTQTPEFNTLLASTLSTIKLTVEQYPELKADTQFTALITELEGSENRIRTSIKDYNDGIVEFNLRIRSFPWGIMLSKMFGFDQKERITPPEDKPIKDVPDVEGLLN